MPITFLPHQRRAIEDLTAHFGPGKGAIRGQYISACGTGKSAVMAAMPKALRSHVVAVVEKNLNIIEQIYRTFENQLGPAGTGFSALVVCSDPNVTGRTGSPSSRKSYHSGGLRTVPDPDATEDDKAIDVTPAQLRAKLHGRVLMDPVDIAAHLDTLSALPATDGPIVVFCTYQSLHLLKDAVNMSRAGLLDLVMFDEAHNLTSERCAILGSDTPDAMRYPPRVGGKLLRAKKMIFVTATQKLSSTPGAFGMDDTAIFGPVVHRYTYSQAVRDKVVAPVDIAVLTGPVNDQDKQNFLTAVAPIIHKSSRWAKDPTAAVGGEPVLRLLAGARIITSLRAGGQAAKFLACSSSVERAMLAAEAVNRLDPGSAAGVHAGMTATMRRTRLQDWNSGVLPVLSHCQLVGEGRDVPDLDAVVLVDPKNSEVELAQLVGRVTRFRRDPTTGAVLDPEKRGLVVLCTVDFDTDQYQKLDRRSSGPEGPGHSTPVTHDPSLTGFGAAQAILAAMDMPGIALCEVAGDPPDIDAAGHNRFVFPRTPRPTPVPRTSNRARPSRPSRDFTGLTPTEIARAFGPAPTGPGATTVNEAAWLDVLPRVLTLSTVDPDPDVLELRHGTAVAAMTRYLQIEKVDKSKITDTDPALRPIGQLSDLDPTDLRLSIATAALLRTIAALQSPVLRGAYHDLLTSLPLGLAPRLRNGDLVVGLPVPDPALGPEGPVTEILAACSHALSYSAITAHRDIIPGPGNAAAEREALAFFDDEEKQNWPREWVRFLARTAGWPGA